MFLCWLGLHAQNNHDKIIHENYKEAINLLQQSKNTLPSDSLLFQNEMKRVKDEYNTFADSLKMYATAAHFTNFETQRLITLCYAAQSIYELKHQQDKLFEHLADNHIHIQNLDSVNEEIAKCLVNSYETQRIWFEDSLLHYVISAMEMHMQSLQYLTWLPVQKQAFVDMYASQYYKRGIISMAEPVFRHFRDVFIQKKTEPKTIKWSADYPVLSARLASTGKKLSDINMEKIGIIATNESPFHLIYLIVQLRTADKAYPNTPVCVFRLPDKVTDNYLLAMKRNLSIDNYYIINLNDADSKTAKQFPCCYYQSENGNIVFSTNNPIDFLEWLEKPLDEQEKKEKEQLHANYEKIQVRKDSIAALPPDSSLQYTITNKNLTVDFKGYWNTKPNIKTKKHYFVESSYSPISDSLKMATLEIFIQQNFIYSLNFLPAGNNTQVSLTADPSQNIKVRFADPRNQSWQNSSQTIDSLLFLDETYSYLIEKYPFLQADFMKKIRQRQKETNQKIQQHIQKQEDNAIRALLQIKYNIYQLYSTEQDTASQKYLDIHSCYPVHNFDSVIWESPYYKVWLDTWITYNMENLQKAIDMLYSAWQIVPNKANALVSEYLWDKMNSMGRFDVMIHIDTTWLAGCTGIKNEDVMKRIEGYKRMAPGKKAPNIIWQKNGAEMDLYGLKADTIIVVFWSDECEHCMKTLPGMYAKLSSRKDFEVVAVAVDEDESSFLIGKKYMPAWHHVWGNEGWQNDIIERYNIFGTPEMYVLDQEHEIIRKQTRYP